MASNTPSQRELVFCHRCGDEWYRDMHGLICPECHDDCVEIIEPNSDPRAEFNFDNGGEDEDEEEEESLRRQANPMASHYPWGVPGAEAPDPDDGDIDDLRAGGQPGMRFTSTTFVSGPGGLRTHTTNSGNPRMADVFPQLLGSLIGGSLRQPGNMREAFEFSTGIPQGASRDTQPPQSQESQWPRPGSAPETGATPTSPLQEGPFRMGGTSRGGIRIMTTSGFGGHTTTTHQNLGADDLLGILSSIVTGIGGTTTQGNPGGRPSGAPGPFNFLAQMLDPANARAGDAVYTNEALDRIISQLMEQHSGSTAPGPASEGAIAALPRIKLSKEMLGDDAKTEQGECAICMDSVPVGNEVAELPCHHWFHGDCVSAWLREHDTCPQCRRGIMRKEGDQNTPRETGQAPRFWQMPSNNDTGEPSSATSETAPASDGASRPRTSGSGGSGLGGSLAGWMGRLRPRGSRSSDGASGGGEGSSG